MPLLSGLIAFYKLSNTNDDLSTYNLTNNNTVTFTTGKIGNAASFASASSQWLSNATDLGITGGAASISFWVNFTTTGGTTGLVTQGDSGTFTYIRCYQNGGNILVARGRNNVAENSVTVLTGAATGTWYHVVYTYDGSTVTGYLNGSSIGTIASSGNGSTSQTEGFAIGRYVTTSSQYHNGLIDAVGVWNRALTSAEVSELYNAGNGVEYPFTPADTGNGASFFGAGL